MKMPLLQAAAWAETRLIGLRIGGNPEAFVGPGAEIGVLAAVAAKGAKWVRVGVHAVTFTRGAGHQPQGLRRFTVGHEPDLSRIHCEF